MLKRMSFKYFAIFLVAVWITLFIVSPNLLVVAVSFLTRDPHAIISPAFTFDNYVSLFTPVYLKIFLKSLIYALFTTLLALMISFPFAYILSRLRREFQKPMLFLVIIPFWTSSLIRTYALIIILKANGIINTLLLKTGLISAPLEILYTDTAVYIGLIYTLLPFMILPLYAAFEKMDHRLVEAAIDLGAQRIQVFSKIIFPLSLPGIMAGCIMVFIPAMGLFYVPDLLGGAKSMLLGNLIKNQFLVSENWPFGSAASVFLSMIMLIMLAVYFKSMKRFNASLMKGQP